MLRLCDSKICKKYHVADLEYRRKDSSRDAEDLTNADSILKEVTNRLPTNKYGCTTPSLGQQHSLNEASTNNLSIADLTTSTAVRETDVRFLNDVPDNAGSDDRILLPLRHHHVDVQVPKSHDRCGIVAANGKSRDERKVDGALSSRAISDIDTERQRHGSTGITFLFKDFILKTLSQI